MHSDAFYGLSDPTLRALATALQTGPLAHTISADSIRRVAPGIPEFALEELVRLHEGECWSPSQLAYLLGSLTAPRADPFSHFFELVLSGPKTQAVDTRDTQAVFRELIESAQSEVLMASYAVYNGKDLFAPLTRKHRINPHFKTSLFLDIPRVRGDTTRTEQIIAAYKQDFQDKQWPDAPLPELNYLKSSLDTDWRTRASMHAKIVVVDRGTLLISSANLTKAAQTKNIEVGALITAPRTANRVLDHFQSLQASGSFVKF